MTDTGKTRAQQLLGDTAPELVRLTDDVLFGQVWADPGLSPRDRSLVTVAALVSLCRTDQLRSHLRRAMDNGLGKDELVSAITHLAFYAGWPAAMSAMRPSLRRSPKGKPSGTASGKETMEIFTQPPTAKDQPKRSPASSGST